MMKNLLSITAKAAIILYTSGAAAGELPTFELRGFPISRHQVSVVGTADVEERSPEAALTLAGMPASPHQIAVLTPRSRVTEAAATNLAKNTSSEP
jgi:hypothetical protein